MKKFEDMTLEEFENWVDAAEMYISIDVNGSDINNKYNFEYLDEEYINEGSTAYLVFKNPKNKREDITIEFRSKDIDNNPQLNSSMPHGPSVKLCLREKEGNKQVKIPVIAPSKSQEARYDEETDDKYLKIIKKRYSDEPKIFVDKNVEYIKAFWNNTTDGKTFVDDLVKLIDDNSESKPYVLKVTGDIGNINKNHPLWNYYIKNPEREKWEGDDKK